SFFSLSPFLRGEGWGEGLCPQFGRQEYAETPPHPALRADLSPQAGRGEKRSRGMSGLRKLLLHRLARLDGVVTLVELDVGPRHHRAMRDVVLQLHAMRKSDR